MSKAKSMLVTSEMMASGVKPLLFTGGACNIQDVGGSVRNPGRDPLAAWLDERGWPYFEPQIHPLTHGRDYAWEIDGPQEKQAREIAKLRVYEIVSTTLAAVTALEIMDDAWRGRDSIVWFNNGRTFAPIGLGDRDALKGNETLQRQVGDTVYSHLVAYANSGRQLRNELQRMLADCPGIIFVFNLDELKTAIEHLLAKVGD